jgi:prepilin-type N-terminal cleavage/methylation domain-containing protein
MRRCSRTAPQLWVERAGFTVIELIIVILIFSMVTSVALPAIARITTHSRVNQAAMVVGHDLTVAASAAARQRKPIRITLGGDRQSFTVADRASATVLQTRWLGPDTQYGLDSVYFSASPVDLFPSGFASNALIVTLSARGYSRQVTMSRAGWVRVP